MVSSAAEAGNIQRFWTVLSDHDADTGCAAKGGSNVPMCHASPTAEASPSITAYVIVGTAVRFLGGQHVSKQRRQASIWFGGVSFTVPWQFTRMELITRSTVTSQVHMACYLLNDHSHSSSDI